MTFFPEGTRTPFARAISAEVRAVMAARRITGRTLAKDAGFASNNYLAIRLRDEKPFTLDDLSLICEYFDEGVTAFVQRAYDNHEERLWNEAGDAADAAQQRYEEAFLRVSTALAERHLGSDPEAPANTTDEEAQAASAVGRLDRHARDTRPARKRSMQQLDDQAARDEDSGGA